MQNWYLKVLFSLFILSNHILASQDIKFGVFAYLGNEETHKKYSPLVKYLSETLNKNVVLEVLSQEEMEEKINLQELHIATTNPTHFLVIRQKFALSGAIATLVGINNNTPTSNLGGVIITRSDSTINSLADIRGKKIATPSIKHMGGFRAQAYELYKIGIDLTKNNKNILELKSSHQDVVNAVLNKKADVGFIRDGVIEAMVNEGFIHSEDFKIINEQHNTKHPYVVSTALYPEWPVFALPYTDENIVKEFIAALFSIKPTTPHAIESKIAGYTLPADYLTVENLARTLRVEPFDEVPTISYLDIWNQYKIDIILSVVFLTIGLLYYLSSIQRKKLVESLLSNMGDGVYGVDKNGFCIWINKKGLDLLGFKKEEVLYKDQHKLFHHHKTNNQNYNVCDCPIHKTIQDREHRECEDYFIRKDGTFFPVSITVAPLDHNNGAIVIFKDISLKKIQENEIKKAKEKLEITLEASQIGVWEWDLENNIILWDKNCYKMLGLEDQSFDINYETWQSLLHPQDQKNAHNEVQSQLSYGDTFRIEFRYKNNYNGWTWIEGRGKAISKDINGKPTKMVGTHTNITQIKDYEKILEEEVRSKTKELDELNISLEEKIAQEVEKNRQKDILLQQQTRLAAIGEMMGNIAHQWRQPLSAITSSISGLKLKEEFGILEPNDIIEVNDCIMNNAQFLSQTIDNFRNFFKKDLPQQEFAIADAINDTINIIKASYEHHFIMLDKKLDPNIKYTGNKNLLSQIVLNLLANSKDAFEKSDIEHRNVSIKLFIEGNFVNISIIDNCGGIKDDIIDKIFDPYFTTKHQSQGTGLGLYMSTQIIHNHFNGIIEVSNIKHKHGYGACFIVKFPLEKSE